MLGLQLHQCLTRQVQKRAYPTGFGILFGLGFLYMLLSVHMQPRLVSPQVGTRLLATTPPYQKYLLKKTNKYVMRRGYWVGTAAKNWHVHDPKLSSALIAFFKSEKVGSILDLGAGTGAYAKDFMGAGLFVTCYDGNPNTQELTEGRCGILDLSNPISLTPHDWVMSLEVGEHIPREFEKTFIQNLHHSNKQGIILSWAVLGQGGVSHVNNRQNKYIISQFENMGYIHDNSVQSSLRNASTLSYFRHTILVFRKLNIEST